MNRELAVAVLYRYGLLYRSPNNPANGESETAAPRARWFDRDNLMVKQMCKVNTHNKPMRAIQSNGPKDLSLAA